jgi:transcriptional regulator with XRE-family HTH domain
MCGVKTMISRKEKTFYRALGLRLMMQRQSQRISQEELGAYIGVSAQQVQKYENGINRISPEKLHRCAEVFKIPIGYFYGEGEASELKKYDRNILLTASEIDSLPEDIQRSLMHHVRVVDRVLRQICNDNKRA